ncbi:MAG TPA: Hsp70 family protein [Thermoanaerobaculia bacterium]|nr:Hsp70 family protein [Thermoanaerobaculia bacterium]
MRQAMSIGVDFGSTGLRVAYVGEGGRPVVLPDRPGSPWPCILCEPRSGGRLGISFPSLKSRLGTNGTPADLVTQAFRGVKRSVEEHASHPVSEVVVTVPALYSAAQRTGLREAVLAAGFADVHLLNDSVAAVIAHTAQGEGPATVLVYAMGYAGFEAGLIRAAAHGRYRALGYEGGGTPAGRAFDELLLEALLGYLEEQRLRPGTDGWDAARWLQVRVAAERMKEGLSAGERALFPLSLETSAGQPLGCLSLDRSGFEAAIRPAVDRTFDQIASLLDQAGMPSSQVDDLLLVGGSTRIPILPSLVAGALGRQPVVLDGQALARGAALFAAQLGSRPLPAGVEPEGLGPGGGDGAISADQSALRAALSVAAGPLPQALGERLVLAAGEPSAGSALAGGAALLRPVVRLLDQGRSAEARALLEEVLREAHVLLAKTEPPAPEVPPPSSGAILARRALLRAQQFLNKGQHEKALQESHVAWQQDRENPDTFEKMIDIHCQAAMTSGDADSYADAQRWLLCAHTHDAGNMRVRHLMAELHYQQARRLAEQGQRQQALETLESCIAWNPEHDGARELHASLIGR